MVSSPQILFYLFAGGAALAALLVVTARNVVHCAIYLASTMVALAGVYFLLLADFLALVQLLLYAGAVSILVLFALMLTRARGVPLRLDNPQKPWAALVGAAFLAILIASAFLTPWPLRPGAALERVPIIELGGSLFSRWAVPFEAASLVLLVALMGAIIIARPED